MDYYSVSDVAKLLGVHEKTIRRYINNGNLEAMKIGGQWRISEEAYNRFLSPVGCSACSADAHISGDDFCVFMDSDYFTSDDPVQICTILDFLDGKSEPGALTVLKAAAFDALMAGKKVKLEDTRIDHERKTRIVIWAEPIAMADILNKLKESENEKHI